jgi:cytochrome c biogenesis protein CcmG, thiol:disulfide interchange protein DsbE
MDGMRARAFGPLLVAMAVLVAACGGGNGDYGDGDAPLLLPADPTQLPTMTYAEFETLLVQLRGTPIVVNIWASWCGPCIDEAPDLADAADRYEGRVQFIGVDILDNRESARDFIREFGWTYPSVFDPIGEIRDRLGLFGQPVTLFYDGGGERVSVWIGATTPQILEDGIRAILQ